MNDVKKCPHCGREIHSNAQYCMYCMTSLQPKQDITQQSGKKNRWTVIAIILLVIAVAVLALLITISANRKEAGNDAGGQTSGVTGEDPTQEDTEDPSGEETQPSTGESQPISQPDSKNETQTDHQQTSGNKDTDPDPTEDKDPDPTEETDPDPTVEVTEDREDTKPVCAHNYIAATCAAPITCTKCGDTIGTVDQDAHLWDAVTVVVHHDEVGHYEDDEVYFKKTQYQCFYCSGETSWYDSMSELAEHFVTHEGRTDYSWISQRDDLLADEREVWYPRTEQIWVVDQKAYDETLITGYVCSRCGDRKEA